MVCFFASDLHGSPDRYEKLFHAVADERPDAVFLGGDLLPGGFGMVAADDDGPDDFVRDVILDGLDRLHARLGAAAPRVFLILGNDDPRIEEGTLLEASDAGLLHYLHERSTAWEGRRVYGYSCIPPSPFWLKDWERYDVSRFVDAGCTAPDEGGRTVPASESEIRLGTIAGDLERLTGTDDLSDAVFLFHAPPHGTLLDRAGLDGMMVDSAPLDIHIGSIAIRRFIELRQPLLTLHGHVHESARLTGCWRDRLGRTHLLGGAHDGPELALVRFDPERLESADRRLL